MAKNKILNTSLIFIGVIIAAVFFLQILSGSYAIPGLSDGGILGAQPKDKVVCNIDITHSALGSSASITSSYCKIERKCTVLDSLGPFSFFGTKGSVIFIADNKQTSTSFDVNIFQGTETKQLSLCVSPTIKNGEVKVLGEKSDLFDSKAVTW